MIYNFIAGYVTLWALLATGAMVVLILALLWAFLRGNFPYGL